MAGTAGEIFLSGMNYQGQASAGGYTYAPLDTKPLEDLAKYTMLYNKAEYDQRQKNADEKIAELAKIAELNANDLRGKDRDEFLKEWNKAAEDGQEYARKTAKTPKEKVEQYLEWKQKVQGVANKFVSGKARAIKYVKELDEINNSTDDADTKAVRKKQLDEMFDKTPINEQFGSLPKYETSTIDIPKPIASKIETVAIGDNEDIIVEGTIFNPKENLGLVNATEVGLAKLYPPKGSPAYNNLSEDEKKQADVQGTIDSKAKIWADMAGVMNSVLQTKDAQGNLKYYTKDAQGNILFDEDKFKKDNALNPLVMGSYNILKEMSEYSKKKIENTKGGIFEDKNFKYKLPTSINPDGSDFLPGVVDFNSGEIKTNQLILASMYAQHGGDKFEKKLQLTGDKLQEQQLAEQKRAHDLENSRFWAAFNKGSTEDLLSADAVIKEVSDVVNSGTPTQVIEYKGGKRTVRDNVVTIGDPNLLKEFGTIDKDGNVTNVPSVVHYNEKTNKLALVYYKSDEAGTGIEKKNGEPVVDREVDMSPTQWLGQVTRRKNPNKDIGGVNTLIDQVYSKYGRNLKKLATGYLGGATISTGSKTTESGKVGGSKWDQYKTN